MCGQTLSLDGWWNQLKHNFLYEIKKGQGPKNKILVYKDPVGCVDFYRNCLGHVRDLVGGEVMDDGSIVLLLEDDLPSSYVNACGASLYISSRHHT